MNETAMQHHLNVVEDNNVVEAGDVSEENARKPRVALMGEFSAGKSTLANLLIGEAALPTKVTATQLPPVWISYGCAAPYRIGLDGEEEEIDLGNPEGILPADTQFIRAFCKSDVLEICDLIDMPGISDPNMPAEVWERVSHFADAVIWCTHATQAWRQSEAAVWESFPETLFDHSLLLLTRIDKLTNERDRQRVVRRVETETDGLFRNVFPISLTQALEAGNDFDNWQASGADAFANALIEVVNGLAFDKPDHGVAEDQNISTDEADCEKARVLVRETIATSEPESPLELPGSRITPRRIVHSGNPRARGARPTASELKIGDF